MNPFPRKLILKNGLAVTVDVACPEELDEISEFVRQFLFLTSPVCYLVKNCPNITNIQEFVAGLLHDPVSLTVRDSNGKLVAVRLNELELRNGTSLDVRLLFDKDEKALLVSMMDDLTKDFDLFETFKTDKVFCMVILSVDPSYGRLGLGATLVEMSLELARSCGAGGVNVYTFSDYAARIASKHGMETLKSIEYATFKFNGDRPLACEEDLLKDHSAVHYKARNLALSK